MRRRGLARLVPNANIAGTLYGTVLVSSVIVSIGAETETAWEMIASIAVTAIVFAIAHGWAVALDHSAAARQPLTWTALNRGMAHEWAIAEAAAPAIIALALAAVGFYSKNTGLWIAISANTALLFVWGMGLRQLAGGTTRQLITAGLLSAALGLVLVLLKVLVH
jgi:hypothetical protein